MNRIALLAILLGVGQAGVVGGEKYDFSQPPAKVTSQG
jgi:hypothetical protein